MKSLVSWMCLIMASASHQVFADDAFNAYRLGDYSQAVEPLQQVAGTDPVANYYLGRIYLYGYGQLKNNKLALRYFTQSADKGYLPAILLMAKYELLQKNNPEVAAGWFKKAAAAGDVSAQMFMAAASLYGVGVKPNQDAATRYFIDAAKNGNAIAQYALGENFIDSRHSSNKQLGVIWLAKSAAQNNPKAQTRLGALYVEGNLTTKDISKGLELLNKAAAANYVPAWVELGNAALAQDQYEQAIQWYTKAADQQDVNAYARLAQAYLQDKTPIYDPEKAFSWALKAAQNGSATAKSQLASMYQKGIGVKADPALAKEWLDKSKAKAEAKPANTLSPLQSAALWLSNGATDKLEQTAFQSGGILSAWNNPAGLRNNVYNQAPKLDVITRNTIFTPQFTLTQPNDIPISTYYDALVSKQIAVDDNQWAYPLYHLNPVMESLEKMYSPVMAQDNLPAPYQNANYFLPDDFSNASVMDIWTGDWQKHVNYMSVFNTMYFRALLGNPQSQFEIGQMFQYGIGVRPNEEAAIVFYQNAAEQQHLGAEYNLGILYLRRGQDASDYQIGLNWLTDGAFKGNRQSQYVLAHLLDKGVTGTDGKAWIEVNKPQALSMLYLSAANHYGPAQYQLAEHLARSLNDGLNVEVKTHKIALIRSLYQGAAKNGVSQAILPLAFYNAMDNSRVRQEQAFNLALSRAEEGDEKAALLLGILYDRGIGTAVDHTKAIEYYQKSGENVVSQFVMGTYRSEGTRVTMDKEQGESLLSQAAQTGFAYADFNLAMLKQQTNKEFLPDLVKAYQLGDSHAGIVLADYYLAENKAEDQVNQAKAIYTELANKGDQHAQLKLGFMMEQGLGSPKNPTEAQHWLTASAEQGNPKAEYLLGQLYQAGTLGTPDYDQARYWYQKSAQQMAEGSVALGFLAETVYDDYRGALLDYQQAANQGSVSGSYDLALMYEYGKGVPVDYTKAKELLQQAADKGISDAMMQLGSLTFYGLGGARNVDEAIAWYKKAAEAGNGGALYALGLLTETGVGTTLDLPAALQYYQQAADKGDEKAMLAVARMYHYGIGVAKDPKVSSGIYQKLATKQNAYAQYRLGTYYLDGTAGERVPEKARQLLEQSSANGNLQARKILQKLSAQTQDKVSYLEPVLINTITLPAEQGAALAYMDAVNDLNRGDEDLSRMLLQRLLAQYPDYIPAQSTFERLNQAAQKKHYIG